MTHDPTRDCAHGRLKGKCDVCDLQAEVLEQCRINGMSAEREDALAAELARLKASIALDKKAENARELGLDYEPAVQEVRLWAVFCGGCRKEWSVPYQHPGKSICAECEAKCKDTPPAPQPVPVKTYHDGKPWPVAPKPWVGLSDEELNELTAIHSGLPLYRAIEAKLKEKNHD